VSWSTVGSAVSYQIERSSGGGPFVAAGIESESPFIEGMLPAGVTYLYRVRAIDSFGTPSLNSAFDPATTILFTDDPLIPGVTIVKALHLLQLRDAVNAFRAAAGLGAGTYGEIVAGVTPIRASDINELRLALAAARSALALPPLDLTDPSLTSGMTVRRAHVQEIRNAVY